MTTHAGAIFISFDAVAVSGITVEALKVARCLAKSGIKSYLDIGYDIKIDKGNFNKPYDVEQEIYKDVFTLVRIDDIDSIPWYNVDFIDYSHNVLISQKTPVSAKETEEIVCAIEEAAQLLAQRIVQLWEKLNISYVFVENGTLPENIIYTKALYLAIAAYGKRQGKGNFVVWRDHDLMWNSEKTVMKYGPAPYPHAVKPVQSPYITYVTLNNHLKNKLEEWCHNKVEVKVKKNTYDFSRQRPGQHITQRSHAGIRESLSIRDNDILIARTTRIIPQKRIDRDIHLVHQLNLLFRQDGIDRKVFLVAAGNPHENYACYQELVVLSKKLNIEPLITFIGSLPHAGMPVRNKAHTIEDLYQSCDLVSFLTSWDYDSYGNPVGEAISAQRCYITSSYEYYWEVYGQHGFEAPVMEISEENDGLPAEAFIADVYRLLNDKQRMDETAHRNFLIGEEVIADNVIGILDLA